MSSPRRFKKWPLALLALGLAFAIGLQWYGGLTGPPTHTPPLATLLPRELSGWQVKDNPLAESAGERAAISEVLNYDDAVFRIYQRGPEMFAVYFAHWDPGKMSPRLVANHTPDYCWAFNGWVRKLEQEQRPSAGGRPETDTVAQLLAKSGLMAGQFRIYEKQDTTQHLLFWHVFGGETKNYNGVTPGVFATFTDLREHGLNQRQEQWFVRISSTVPLSGLWADPGFQQVIQQLKEVCLHPPVTASAK